MNDKKRVVELDKDVYQIISMNIDVMKRFYIEDFGKSHLLLNPYMKDEIIITYKKEQDD